MTSLPLDDRTLQDLAQKFDPEMRFRPLLPPAVTVVGGLLIALSAFHYYTAGFGLLQEVTHRGVHLAFVLGLIFLVFPHRRALLTAAPQHRWASPGGVPWFDWLLALGIGAAVLYIPWIFDDLGFRVGYRRAFAAAVEAATSTGGQITPPVLGAAAFLMIEFLALPYQTIIAAATIPAFMHFFGVFMQVHFEAKRFGLRGLTEAEMPRLRQSFHERWPTLIPMFLLIFILVSGRTPYLAAFCGISSCAIVGLSTKTTGNNAANWGLLAALHAVLGVIVFGGLQAEGARVAVLAVGVVIAVLAIRAGRIQGRIAPAALVEAFETGAKYALAVGAAAATVGIVIGVVTLTGVGFKLSTIITGAANAKAGRLGAWLPAALVDPHTLALTAALVMTGLVCILLGCGIPTTANYIIMVTVAAPTLVLMGVEPLVAHFFVFYYGVLADITPPVALAAYAAAGMAGSDPIKTGNMAFRLGLAKALVPFVFVFSPSLLLVAKGFTWYDFSVTFIGCVLGITLLAGARSRWLLVEMRRWEQALCSMAAVMLVAPGLISGLLGLAVATPMLLTQLGRWRLLKVTAASPSPSPSAGPAG